MCALRPETPFTHVLSLITHVQFVAVASLQRLRRAGPDPMLPQEERSLLLACLRAKKYDAHKAASLLASYNGFRLKCGWTPSTMTATSLQTELASGLNLLLPQRDAHGHWVITQQMARLLGTTSPIETMQRSGFYLMHRALQRSEAQTHGLALLVDFAGFSFSALLRRIRLADIRRGMTMVRARRPLPHSTSPTLSGRIPDRTGRYKIVLRLTSTSCTFSTHPPGSRASSR